MEVDSQSRISTRNAKARLRAKTMNEAMEELNEMSRKHLVKRKRCPGKKRHTKLCTLRNTKDVILIMEEELAEYERHNKLLEKYVSDNDGFLRTQQERSENKRKEDEKKQALLVAQYEKDISNYESELEKIRLELAKCKEELKSKGESRRDSVEKQSTKKIKIEINNNDNSTNKFIKLEPQDFIPPSPKSRGSKLKSKKRVSFSPENQIRVFKREAGRTMRPLPVPYRRIQTRRTGKAVRKTTRPS
ncbi:Oidioi.mRNA.OKI2018_I69.XSR.g16628.t1.cds [Oikopleura dioica]|uniref:Oidioi.mRNA.OKI2018_I69.XSR.g16628.t1.cds n=1 Tax=Oikopleura dioica TaxID=34765 RepID=A0ABN7SGQ5_OIKDI|nr:Oidioi.mRNA.OKI2018_I69.XSR.g16628.t1.cds [Oikopleura dioica]